MDDKPKLVKNLPPPSEVTDEDRKKVLKESRAWSKHFAKMAKDITNITPEDWRTIAR